MSAIKQVVILVQENRSFDEYFGMFPGVSGYFDPVNQFSDQYGSGLQPFRMSSYSAGGCEPDQCSHGWPTVQAVYGAASAPWNQPGNPQSVMGYYAANDIPFHWALADTFALCDHFFCSVLGATAPNRLYLMTGTITSSDGKSVTGDPPDGYPAWFTPTWPTYLDALTNNTPPVSWRIYDETEFTSDWPTAPSPINANNDWSLNIVDQFPNWGTYENDPAHYQTTLGQFEADAKGGNLPTVSWIIPPFGASEWENNHPCDGASYIATKLDALFDSPQWDSTAFILVYDEHGGHFDHIHPTPPPGGSTQLSGSDPIGPGYRIPAIVVSPWTVGKGVQKAPFDFSSILQLLHDVTHVECPNTMPVSGFGSLSSVFDFSHPGVSAQDVQAKFPWRSALTDRSAAFANQRLMPFLTHPSQPPGMTNPPVGTLQPPAQNVFPGIPQACGIVLVQSSYGKGEVTSQAKGSNTATFRNALFVNVAGFEPIEMTTTQACFPLPTPPFPPGPPPAAVLPSPSTQPTLHTRIPAITFTYDGQPVTGITASCSSVTPDPSQTVTETGIPGFFTFVYDVTFTDVDTLPLFNFPINTTKTLQVEATFAVDTTVSNKAALQLVTSTDPQFYQLFPAGQASLSNELRVFQLKASDRAFTLTSTVGSDPATFTKLLLDALNADTTSAETWFDGLKESESQSWLSLLPTNNEHEAVYNFGLARVHMEGLEQAEYVRVFLRLFPGQTTSTEYSDYYNSITTPAPPPPPTPGQVPPPAGRISVPGLGAGAQQGQYVTLPFYATDRVAYSRPLVDQRDRPNVRNIPADGVALVRGKTYAAYYGCWLDINQSQEQYIPRTGVPANDALGPFTQHGPRDPESPLAWIRGLHQCLLAEISYDPITIPYLATPGTCAWLAQRNVAWVPTAGGQ